MGLLSILKKVKQKEKEVRIAARVHQVNGGRALPPAVRLAPRPDVGWHQLLELSAVHHDMLSTTTPLPPTTWTTTAAIANENTQINAVSVNAAATAATATAATATVTTATTTGAAADSGPGQRWQDHHP